MSSALRVFARGRRTARLCAAVVDLPLFSRIFNQLDVLDGVERPFEHEKSPSYVSPATNEWEYFSFPILH